MQLLAQTRRLFLDRHRARISHVVSLGKFVLRFSTPSVGSIPKHLDCLLYIHLKLRNAIFLGASGFPLRMEMASLGRFLVPKSRYLLIHHVPCFPLIVKDASKFPLRLGMPALGHFAVQLESPLMVLF